MKIWCPKKSFMDGKEMLHARCSSTHPTSFFYSSLLKYMNNYSNRIVTISTEEINGVEVPFMVPKTSDVSSNFFLGRDTNSFSQQILNDILDTSSENEYVVEYVSKILEDQYTNLDNSFFGRGGFFSIQASDSSHLRIRHTIGDEEIQDYLELTLNIGSFYSFQFLFKKGKVSSYLNGSLIHTCSLIGTPYDYFPAYDLSNSALKDGCISMYKQTAGSFVPKTYQDIVNDWEYRPIGINA